MLPRPASSRKVKPHLSSLILTARRSLGILAENGPPTSGLSSASSGHASEGGLLGSLPIMQLGLPSAKTTAFVISCLLWYLSSALSSNTSKALLSSPKHLSPRPPPPFPYPVTLTLIQFVFVHLLSAAVASPTIMRQIPGVRKPVTRLAKNPGWDRILDMAKLSIFNVVGHALSTVAISRVPVSTVHTIKALTPLFTVLSFHFFFHVHYSFMTYLSLLPLTLGVMMACTSLSFSANDIVGLATALTSTLIFVAQSIYSKNLIGRGESSTVKDGKQDREGKLDKVNILYYSSACSVFIMIPMALYYDGSALLSRSRTTDNIKFDGSSASSFYSCAMIIANGVVQFFQAFLAFSVLMLVSPVTYSIASLFKRVFVICFAILWFGQSVSTLQWFGIVLTFVGLYLYNDSKAAKSIAKGEDQLREGEKAKSMSLPTTMANVSVHQSVPASSSSVGKTSYDAHDAYATTSTAATRPHVNTRSDVTGIGGFRDFSQIDVTSPNSSRRLSTRRPTQDGMNERSSNISPFFKDPRQALPSPPPSRGPSSDEGDNSNLITSHIKEK
ncbi:hypothetical protein CBS101457_003421 [Exobasidium rhododendri]|nr:hypothetical protein CBS101457_003421 [Exobasidium rhododendri]